MADAPLESVQDAARAAECCVEFRVRNLRKKVVLGLCSLELTSVSVSVETRGAGSLRFQWNFSYRLCNICKRCLSSNKAPSRRVGLAAILKLRLLLKGKQ